MATKFINGIEYKKCTECKEWKPCIEFPKDPSHGEKQCFSHCKCKSCHRKNK